MKKYYQILPDDNKRIGVLMSTPNSSIPKRALIDLDERPKYSNLIELELKDGEYADFMSSDFAFLFSQELKDFIETRVCDSSHFEFIPVAVKSRIYGNRTYYFANFKTDLKVVDKDRCIYQDGTDNLIITRLNYNKVKHLDFFSTYVCIPFGKHVYDGIILSSKFKREIKKAKLDSGIIFSEIKAIEDSDNIEPNELIGVLHDLRMKLYGWLMSLSKEITQPETGFPYIRFKRHLNVSYEFDFYTLPEIPNNQAELDRLIALNRFSHISKISIPYTLDILPSTTELAILDTVTHISNRILKNSIFNREGFVVSGDSGVFMLFKN